MAGDPAWLTIDCEGERRHVRLDLEVTTIGRNEANVIDLPDKRLSRFHCEIHRRGDDYVVRDCGSRNGTKLNGSRLSGEAFLASGDTVEIGGSTILFRLDRPIDADPGNNLVPIAPIPRSVRKATTIYQTEGQRIDLSGQTPDEAFDPRPTIPIAATPTSRPRPVAAVPPPPPPPPPPPATPAPAAAPEVDTRWRKLGDAIARLSEVASSEQVAVRLAEHAFDLVPARQILVLVPSAPGDAPRPSVVWPQPAPGATADSRFSSAVVEEVLATKKTVSVQDLKQDQRWGIDYSVLGLDLRGAIAVPLLALGRVRGVLYVDEPRAVASAERDEAIALLEALAGVAASALVATGSSIAADDARSAADAARAAQLATEALPPASGLAIALKVRPGRGAFAEVHPLPEHAGRRELAVFAALATGAPLDVFRLEVAARAAFRALAHSMPRADALLRALADALGPELDGRSLRAAVFRVDPLSTELHVASAGLGIIHRSHQGHVLAVDAAAPALTAQTVVAPEEIAIAWEPGDLCLLAAPAPSDLPIAPWLTDGPGATADAVIERAAAELPEAAALVALRRS